MGREAIGNYQPEINRPENARQESAAIISVKSERAELSPELKERIQREFEAKLQQVKEDGKNYIGSGKRATVYASTEDQVLAPYAIKVNDLSRQSQYMHERDLTREADMHEEIYDVVESWRVKYAKSSVIPNIKIPRPIGRPEPIEGTSVIEYFVMEKIQGKTLMRALLENHIRHFGKAWLESAQINAGETSESKDQRRERILQEKFGLSDNELFEFALQSYVNERQQFVNPDDGKEYLKIVSGFIERLCRSARNKEAMTPGQFEALKGFIMLAKREGFYHRDLTPSNIMLTDDGKVAIIDFATAIRVNPKTADTEEIYENGHYDDDLRIVNLLKPAYEEF